MAEQLDTLHVHPGILDSAFQMFIPLLALAQHSEFAAQLAFVPVRVGRIQVNAEAGAPVLARAVMGKRAPHSFTADFELYDAQGRAVAVLSQTRFKAIRLNRAHHQHFSYLDVELTPAPLKAAALPLPADALTRLMGLSDAYTASTGQRYAQEVALLDSLSEAFVQQANGGDDDESPAPETIWQLLVQEYPDYFAPIHLVGRLGLHREPLLNGRDTLESLGISAEHLAGINRVLIGENGWQVLARELDALMDASLATLPDGQHLNLLEAGPCAPALGQRLLEQLAHGAPATNDRYRYRALTTSDTARHQAEQLQERYPLMDIQSLDEALPALTAAQRHSLRSSAQMSPNPNAHAN
ncbi:hypothetical protein HAALTHF_29890n [Vreelandella aquamarina]|nr:hypothetical protein HAALTHF_29890n [Halomonas axialensis]